MPSMLCAMLCLHRCVLYWAWCKAQVRSMFSGGPGGFQQKMMGSVCPSVAFPCTKADAQLSARDASEEAVYMAAQAASYMYY